MDKVQQLGMIAADQADMFTGAGWLWMACFVRLMIFSIILAPGFFLMTMFYFLSNRVHRNLWYSSKVRYQGSESNIDA